MRKLIGILSPIEVFDHHEPEFQLKREALLFHKLSIPHLDCIIRDQVSYPKHSNFISLIEWLIDKQVILFDSCLHSTISGGGSELIKHTNELEEGLVAIDSHFKNVADKLAEAMAHYTNKPIESDREVDESLPGEMMQNCLRRSLA